MYPIIFSFGALTLRTLNIFLVLFFLATGFVLWRKSREEHYSEIEVFDGFLLSYIFALFVSRLGFILFNFAEFGFEILKWFNFVAHPGSSQIVFLLANALYLYHFAKKKKWDAFELTDFWSQAICLGLFFLNLGHFFDGSLFGKATNLPWGMVFPGMFEKRHPTQLYFALFYLGLYFVLNWLENNYRTFEWYRAGKKAAQTGFLLCAFLIVNSLFLIFMSLIKLADIVVNGMILDAFVHIFLLFFAFILLVKRSGKTIFPKKRVRTTPWQK